jgi:hypothetical protein
MRKARNKKRGPEDSTRPRGRRTVLIAGAVVLALGILTAVVLLRGSDTPGFGSLTGRWLRLDGGYILEIKSVDAGGGIDATYLNPRPISVARAEATREGSTLKVFVELRAPDYPGSTYTLTYDRRNDQLEGVYFQAVLRQSFDVRFVRFP